MRGGRKGLAIVRGVMGEVVGVRVVGEYTVGIQAVAVEDKVVAVMEDECVVEGVDRVGDREGDAYACGMCGVISVLLLHSLPLCESRIRGVTRDLAIMGQRTMAAWREGCFAKGSHQAP
jgi:hypothetical protein